MKNERNKEVELLRTKIDSSTVNDITKVLNEQTNDVDDGALKH